MSQCLHISCLLQKRLYVGKAYGIYYLLSFYFSLPSIRSRVSIIGDESATSLFRLQSDGTNVYNVRVTNAGDLAADTDWQYQVPFNCYQIIVFPVALVSRNAVCQARWFDKNHFDKHHSSFRNGLTVCVESSQLLGKHVVWSTGVRKLGNE